MHLCLTSVLRSTLRVTRTAVLIAACSAAVAPTAPGQAVQTGGTRPPETSRFDLYAGYGYFHPLHSSINGTLYEPINPGAVSSATFYFNRYLGFQAEGSFFPHGPNDCVFTPQAGPVLRYQKGRFVPFLHVLGGGAKVGGPAFQPCTWGWGLTGGLGLDYILPLWNNHLAVRPIQADFDYSHVDYGPLVLPGGVSGGLGKIQAYRLSSGLVWRFGATAQPAPVQLGCTIQPVDAYPGDPLTVTAIPANLNASRKTTYTWTATGGNITGNDTTANVTTAGLAPGDYAVTGHVSQGPRPSEQATCTASFRVHAFQPPTISCAANPSTVISGDTTTITTSAQSPQNRPLTYSYSTSSGLVSGDTATATLNTTGTSPGTIIVTCNVVDDLGQQVTASTPVIVTARPEPIAISPRTLCTISFSRDKKRPVRVDNEAKSCLDEVALNLNREATATLVIVGQHNSDESPQAAAERTMNVQQYLTDEKGIDPARIQLRTSNSDGQTVENTLVPAGATFDTGSTATFDAGSIKRHGTPYGRPSAPKAAKKIR